MGVYVKGAFGAFSGKVGNIVGSNWRSIDYMRSQPKLSNKKASQKQLTARAKFAQATEFLAPLRSLINKGLSNLEKKKSTAFHYALSNVIQSMEGDYPDFRIRYENIVLSKGNLSPLCADCDCDIEGVLTIKWEPRMLIGTAENADSVYILLYHEDEGEFYLYNDIKRGDGECVINLSLIGYGSFQAWTFLSNYSGTRFSNNQYNGKIEII